MSELWNKLSREQKIAANLVIELSRERMNEINNNTWSMSIDEFNDKLEKRMEELKDVEEIEELN